MTGRRRTFLPRPSKTAVLAAAAAACTSLIAGCGVIPGTTGGSRDDPITVMTWAPEKTKATNKPGVPAMAQAYARWVNAHGGIDGRELKVLTCNDHNDPVGAAGCAREAVDEDVVAVVGAYSQHGRSFLAPLELAGIPYIGGYGITDDEFSSPLSYPVNGGEPALLAGNGRQLAARCDRVALVRPDTLAGDELPKLLNSGLRDGHHKPVADIRAPEDGTDLTPQAEQALKHAGAEHGCVTAALGARTDTFYDSFRRTKDDYPPVRISSVLGSVDQSLVDRTGGASGPYEGAYVTGWYPPAGDPRWSEMRKVIREQAFGDNRVDPADAGVQTTWIAYTVLKQVVESLDGGEVSALSLRRALDGGLRVGTGGLTPTLRWRFEDLIAASEFPRLINSGVTFQVVRDGKFVPARKGFVDVEQTLEQSA
ncbi:ABC transporter substrate-binding protein [Streptomyces sp. NRRL S-920]|uniref:ABC transporter substrate-binding protein n=1 Tax=Streptomyces sp. NRRL S-920 TaxID=1463921 RepID=UPI0004C5A1AC|nr:ABC transporter substrate-binding protein [Streptomyces sp. NRRL S-920]